MNANPYEPSSVDDRSGNPLLIPAVFLLGCSALFLVALAAALPIMIELFGDLIDESAGPARDEAVLVAAWTAFAYMGLAASNGLTLFGAIAMLRQRQYTLAKCGAIAACVPV